MTSTLHGPTGILSEGQNWLLTDGLGSVRSVAGDALTESMWFEPYGSPIRGGDSGFGYTGQQVDPNGLLYLRARYYDAGAGRFGQIDPSWLEENLYAYASGNPIDRCDPSGLDSCPSDVYRVSPNPDCGRRPADQLERWNPYWAQYAILVGENMDAIRNVAEQRLAEFQAQVPTQATGLTVEEFAARVMAVNVAFNVGGWQEQHAWANVGRSVALTYLDIHV